VQKNGVVLVNVSRAKTVSTGKFTDEEKALLHIGLALACRETQLKFMSANLMPVVLATVEECERESLQLLLEACRENDFLLAPTDEAVFYKTASRL
jgi:hypothetical protein